MLTLTDNPVRICAHVIIQTILLARCYIPEPLSVEPFSSHACLIVVCTIYMKITVCYYEMLFAHLAVEIFKITYGIRRTVIVIKYTSHLRK